VTAPAGELELRVRELVATCFGAPLAEISRATVRDDVEGWDSLGQLNLMLALEDAFDVRLEIEEMQSLVSVDAIFRFLD
jgi:acyl carrier protein